MFPQSLRQDHFSNLSRKFLGVTPPFLYLKNTDIITKIQQKRPSQIYMVAALRDTYAPTARIYVSTESKTRLIQ